MRGMREGTVDLTITSPPYDDLRNYNGYSFDFEKTAKEIYRITKNGGVCVWVVGDKINGGRTLTSFRQCLYFQEIGFSIHDVMIYQKKNTPFMRANAYTNCYEYMFILAKGKPAVFNLIKQKTVRHGKEMLVARKTANGVNNKVLGELKKEKTKTNIWQYAVGLGGTTFDKEAFKHTAMFPESLTKDHILSWSNKGDLVFDPMCGAGTTCKQALINERNYIGGIYKTGKKQNGKMQKIKRVVCVCHCLMDIEQFAKNQNNIHGIVRRPSCRQCRSDIDKRAPKTNQAKRAEKERPQKGMPFLCPICRKRSIVGITAKVVAETHHTGDIRDIICDSCNTGLGRFKNGKNYLNNAITYLEQRGYVNKKKELKSLDNFGGL